MRRILLLFLLLPSLALAENLWPIFQRNVYPYHDVEVDVLGPLFHYERSNNQTAFGLRPLFYYRKKGDISILEFLFPLGKIKWGGKESSHQLIPLWRHREGRDFWLFPYFHGWEKGEFFCGFFPIYGTILNRFGWERIEFILWPIYLREEAKNYTLTRILWPFFSFYTGDGATGLKFWPLFGSYEIGGKERTTFFLWPFFIFQEKDLLLDQPSRRVIILFPLISTYNSKDLDSYTFLWPFFNYQKGKGINRFRQFDFPWPILRLKEGGEGHEFKAFPVFGAKIWGKDRSCFLLWPIYKYAEFYTGKNTVFKKHSFFLINRFSTTYKNGVEVSRSFNIWPFFYYYTKNAYKENNSLTLLPTRDTGFERLYAPFFHIFTLKKDGKRSQYSFLWGFIRAGSNSFEKGISIAWIFDYRKSADGDYFFSFLKGLLGFGRSRGSFCLKFLFIPIRL